MIEHCKPIVFKVSAVLESCKIVFREALENSIPEPSALFLKTWCLLSPIRARKEVIFLKSLEAFNEKTLSRGLTIPCRKGKGRFIAPLKSTKNCCSLGLLGLHHR
jgi:hypothetical protein